MDGRNRRVADERANQLREIASRVARRLVAGAGGSAPGAGVHVDVAHPRPGTTWGCGPESGVSSTRGAEVLTADAVAQIPSGGRLPVDRGALVTPLAREEAERRGIELVEQGSAVDLALAADHGGFALKAELLEALHSRGLRVHDLGTHDRQAVDYPDFALAAAREVAAGRVGAAVVIDGAGIGSAMAANKVPGVRAANGVTVALARNAREHNHANLLTLGAGHHDLASALAVVEAFLATPFGPGRHARRVALIDALDASPLPR
ncbi:MAG: RpiB/LacA/LacB family sugar-phosphate isomerase [Planctomycetota bacterium]